MPESAKGKGSAKFRASVPVWIHVVSDGATGNVPQSVIDKQLSVLNLAFAGFYGGATVRLLVPLAGVTRTDNAEWYNARAGGNAERAMKKTLHRGGFETLNIYTNLAGGFLGYAYLPGLPDSHLWQDGIVLNWESMPARRRPSRAEYDLGQTLTHEAGHWFNLEHTFYGGCNAKGDYVDDTPPMRVPTSGCPEGKDTCARAGARPDPELHGLLVRRLLRGVHRGAGRPHAGRLALPPSLISERGGSSGSRPPLHSPSRARSSGDRALASGARGRTFESCRAHCIARMLRNPEGGRLRGPRAQHGSSWPQPNL